MTDPATQRYRVGDRVHCDNPRVSSNGHDGTITDVFANGAIVRVRWDYKHRGVWHVSDIGACSLKAKP